MYTETENRPYYRPHLPEDKGLQQKCKMSNSLFNVIVILPVHNKYLCKPNMYVTFYKTTVCNIFLPFKVFERGSHL